MKNKTKMTNKKIHLGLSNIIAIIMILLILSAGVIMFIKGEEFAQYGNNNIFSTPLGYILCTAILAVMLFIPVNALIITNRDVKKARSLIDKENKDIENNKAFIYFRELPNNYGIGVNTLLTDSSMENYKDIVAVILDLCAKRYLRLNKVKNKYIVKVLKGIDDKLLSNEKYIMNLILSNELKNINYQEWFNYCYIDGKNLNLFEQADVEHQEFGTPLKEGEFSKGAKIIFFISIFIGLLFISNIMTAIAVTFISFIFMIVVYYIYTIIKGFNNITKMGSRIAYEIEMKNNLLRTEKGRKELEKLFGFRDFIKDFGNFVSKRPMEVMLWDRYLPYAQVFGLTKEIMRTGYSELIKNSSFSIDSIDDITLDNVVKED